MAENDVEDELVICK